MKRREAIGLTATAITGTILGANSFGKSKQQSEDEKKKLKVMVFGAHPDDPETGCGGVISKFSSYGHEVHAVYLTRGEAGIEGKSHEDAAKIRMIEANNACAILKVKPIFLDQIDGATEVNNERYDKVSILISEIKPDIILTHWPIDSHRDHQVCSLLVYDAWFRLGRKSELYYYEVMSGQQSQTFFATEFVDISDVIQQKHDACFAHISQKIKENYHLDHGKMEIFRGLEAGFKYAEAFTKHSQSPNNYSLNSF